jgi:hypothetical protein
MLATTLLFCIQESRICEVEGLMTINVVDVNKMYWHHHLI